MIRLTAQIQSIFAGQSLQFLRLAEVRRNDFFREDMLPCFQGSRDDVVMLNRRRGIYNQFDLRIGENLLKRTLLESVLLCLGLSACPAFGRVTLRTHEPRPDCCDNCSKRCEWRDLIWRVDLSVTDVQQSRGDKIAVAAFTDRGEDLAMLVGAALGARVDRLGGKGISLADWTAAQFPVRRALVFVGAAGIAVRAVAPHLKSKAEDPAVIVLDETGRFVIPILSGHLGGANALAKEIAAELQATAVITTATDLRGVFAVDLWAKAQGMTVLQPERIKRVSAKLLAGEAVAVDCPWPIKGAPPEGVRLGHRPVRPPPRSTGRS